MVVALAGTSIFCHITGLKQVSREEYGRFGKADATRTQKH
jgi:hypothetical protein